MMLAIVYALSALRPRVRTAAALAFAAGVIAVAAPHLGTYGLF